MHVLRTVFDDFNSSSEKQLLIHIAKMMALKDPEYQDAFIANELHDAIAVEMLAYDRKHYGTNYEVIVQFLDAGITETSTFASHSLRGLNDIEGYVAEVIQPISKELSARVVSKLKRPITENACEIKVRSLDG